MIIQKLYDFIKINYFLMPKTQHNEYCVVRATAADNDMRVTIRNSSYSNH